MASDMLLYGVWMLLLFSAGASIANILRIFLGKRSNFRVASLLLMMIVVLLCAFVVFGSELPGQLIQWVAYPLTGFILFFFPKVGYIGAGVFLVFYFWITVYLSDFEKSDNLFTFSEPIGGSLQLQVSGIPIFNSSADDSIVIAYTEIASDLWFLGAKYLVYSVERNGVELPGSVSPPALVDFLGGLELYTISEKEFPENY